MKINMAQVMTPSRVTPHVVLSILGFFESLFCIQTECWRSYYKANPKLRLHIN